MTLKLPKVIGHRGAAAYAPENTLEGIHTAADMDIEWVELDVKLTKDDIPIIFHDDTLERTTNGSGLVAKTTYEDLKQLEAGSWFADSFTGIKIPTLEEAIDVLIERNLGLSLEIKPCTGREKETAEIALDMLSHYWDDHDRLLISSFSHISLEAAQDLARDWARGLLIGLKSPEKWLKAIESNEMPEDWKEVADYLDVSTINVLASLLTKETAMDIIDAEYPLLSFTVNDPMELQKLQRMGVDCVFSDCPDVILENLLTTH